MKRLVLGEKYWTGVVQGTVMRTQFGAIGKGGQTRLKDFGTPAAAKQGLAAAVAEKQREGYVPANGDPSKAAKPAAPAKRRAALLELAAALGDAAVVQQVTLAFDAPEAYAAKYPARIEARSLEIEMKSFAWLALVDALLAKKKLADLDWKHEAEDAIAEIKRLAPKPGQKVLAPLLADEELEEMPTEEALELAGKALAGAQCALLELDIRSDCFEVVVAPQHQVSTLTALAKAAGERLRHFDGRSLVALAKARTRAETASETARANPWGALVEDRGSVDSVLWDIRHHKGQVKKIGGVLEHVPAKDRPLVDLALGLNAPGALKVAASGRDPSLALRAVRYMAEWTPAHVAARFGAAVVLARRLKLGAGNSADHEALAIALNLFSSVTGVERAVAALRAADRALLVTAINGLYKSQKRYSERREDALRALKNIGDASSLALLEVHGNDKHDGADWLAEAKARIAARVSKT